MLFLLTAACGWCVSHLSILVSICGWSCGAGIHCTHSRLGFAGSISCALRINFAGLLALVLVLSIAFLLQTQPVLQS